MANIPGLLIVGTYHMGNPNLDYVNADADDVRTAERQQEMRELLDRLERFAPTKVAVEVPYNQDEELNADYAHYRQGTFALGRDEVHQIGFRIAGELGHERIYPADWWDWRGTEIGLDAVQEAALKFGQQALFDEALGDPEERSAEETRAVRSKRILDVFRDRNQPEALRQAHATHLGLARFGHGSDFTGATWLTQWYERNLKIFANLIRIAQSGDRILLIIGHSHVLPLHEFATDSGLFQVETAGQYLL